MKNINKTLTGRRYASPGFGKCVLITFILLFLFACSASNPPRQSTGHLSADKNLHGDIPKAVSRTVFLTPPEPMPKQETYTVVVNDVPVKELLFALARDAKLNVDIHPKIKGRATLNAIKQTLPQILHRISEQVDLRFTIDGPNLVISPDLPYVRTYTVNYVNMSRNSVSEVSVATEISTTGGSVSGNNNSNGGSGNKSNTIVVNQSENNFWKTLSGNIRLLLNVSESDLKGGNRVVVNPMGGVISVNATEREHVRIQQFVDKVQASVQRQVLIEATIVEVVLNDRYQAGVDWSRLSKNNGDGKNGASIRSLMTGGNLTAAPAFSIEYKNTDRNLFAAVKLLETFGDTRVLSSPKIMAVNNQTALLKVVDEAVYFTVEREFVDATTTSPSRETFTSEIHTVPVGLIMSVTPQVTEADGVMMNVRPTISRITGFKVDPAPRLAKSDFDNLIPEIQVREMESLLQVNSGQTVVLGGLMQNRDSKNKSGVPFLSDLPVVGGLFDYREEQFIKTELVIFLRPTVIHNGSLDGDFKNFRQFLPRLDQITRTEDVSRENVALKEM